MSRCTLDCASVVDADGRRGRIVGRGSRAHTAEELDTGFYRPGADILSLGLRAQL